LWLQAGKKLFAQINKVGAGWTVECGLKTGRCRRASANQVEWISYYAGARAIRRKRPRLPQVFSRWTKNAKESAKDGKPKPAFLPIVWMYANHAAPDNSAV
jgi:hypothetical protein